MDAEVKAEWEHDLPGILKSSRVAEMTFHVPKVDKDKEIISADAMAKALEDYRKFPIISEFHKERPIGIAEKIWQTASDEFKAIIRIREDPSVDDVWAKMNLPVGSPGRYDQVSIAGRRTKFSSECDLHQSVRSADRPCRTTGLRLDSISVCDNAARNSSTSLAVVKASKEDPAAFIYTTSLDIKQVGISLIKAETSDSNLIHPVTDGTTKKQVKCGDHMKKGCNKAPVKKSDEEEKEEKEEMKEEEAEEEKKGEPGEPEKEEMEKAPPEDSTVEAKEADQNTKMMEMMNMIIQKLGELVQSDKKVHSEMKAEPEEKKEEKKVEKAETEKTPAPSEDKTVLTKAEMEQDFKKALDAALAPVLTQIDELKKANTDLAAKLEEYGNQEIVKSGPIVLLNTDYEGKPRLGNAGAIAAATGKRKEANK